MGASFDLNALSGINAASTGLGVISNNLANSQAVGFKGSRTEFADMFSGAQNSAGNGTRVESITQDFSQGSINGTGRELDMAIDGEGFFVLADQTDRYDNVYTRNGSFKLDKDGFLTTQEGNQVQGYLLNETLSTEAEPVFSTALSSIDLDELNKQPKATSEMTYDINLDGEQSTNVDPSGTNYSYPISASDAAFVQGDYDAAYKADDSVGSSNNLSKLINPEANNEFQGFPDYFYPMTVHDSLGGEHTLNANFYKRDVVPAESYTTTMPTAGNEIYDSSGNLVTDDSGNPLYFHSVDPVGPDKTQPVYDSASNLLGYAQPVGNSEGEKYTSWLVQYNITDTDDQGNTVYTGHRYDQATGTATGEAGQVFELRFDTNGNYLGAYKPVDPSTLAGAPDSNGDPEQAFDLASLVNGVGDAYWEPVGGNPQLDFIVDNPFTGATDPLGGLDPANNQISIDLDFESMTQFAGSYNQRGTTQNGYAIGDLVGLNTGLDGVIEARYSNGRSVPVAQLAIANFSDKNAMEKLGGQTYAESFASGAVQLGAPQSNGMGTINAGSLEYSNVDVAGELVNMIQTQRTYQASAQVISTSQQLTQTILQL